MVHENKNKKILTFLSSIKGIGRVSILKMENFAKSNNLSLADLIDKPDILMNLMMKIEIIEEIKLFKKKFTFDSYYQYLQDKDIKVVSYQDFQYPSLLKEIPNFPLILFIKGKVNFISQNPLAIVGTRKMTHYGQIALKKIMIDLQENNLFFISGFMYGIDTLVAELALKLHKNTIGVLGFGFDYLYPMENKKLFDQILETGNGFISEYPPFQVPLPANFVLRNRLIAGMSLATVIIEAAKKSGSLITANFAVEYGREVMAVSGPITSIYCEGVKDLINQGAKLVSCGEDIIAELGIYFRNDLNRKNEKNKTLIMLDFWEQKIIDLLKTEVLTIDDLLLRLQISIKELNRVLTRMEMKGFILMKGDSVLLNVFD